MAKDLGRLQEDLRLACSQLGNGNVDWAKDGSFVWIRNFALPPNFRQAHTDIIILVPETYGYGGCFRDIFIDPGLEVLDRDGHSFRRMGSDIHGYDRYPYSSMGEEMKNKLKTRNWYYLCLHDLNPRSSIVNYLSKVRIFLANPHKDWKAIQQGYVS